MTTISTKSGKVIKVVSSEEEKTTLTESDSEMDARATEAVKAAINKEKICKKPMILVFAGPNGSGKSTITTFFDKVGKYTNADDIVAATGMDNIARNK